jgi:Head domain of trimeric autotransporter adhesin
MRVSVGTASNTYTLAGVTSATSLSRQSGALSFVTTDADGHLATTAIAGGFCTEPAAGSFQCGTGADASGGTNATAVGQNAKANASNATAYGNGANAAGVNATALGQNANALANNSSAVGNGATVAASHTNAAAFRRRRRHHARQSAELRYGEQHLHHGRHNLTREQSSARDADDHRDLERGR